MCVRVGECARVCVCVTERERGKGREQSVCTSIERKFTRHLDLNIQSTMRVMRYRYGGNDYL